MCIRDREEEDDDDEDEEIPLDMEEIEAASKKARQEEALHSAHIQVYWIQHNEPNPIAFGTINQAIYQTTGLLDIVFFFRSWKG